MTLQEPKDKKRQIPVFVAERKTEFVCLGCHKMVPGSGGHVLGAPLKRNWTPSPSRISAGPAWSRGKQAALPRLVYQMSRQILSSSHWHLNHVLDIVYF